jgi:uncharacterized delta-60 repeat protein
MKTKPTSQSAFFNLRCIISLVLVSGGMFLALHAFGAFSNVFAQAKGLPAALGSGANAPQPSDSAQEAWVARYNGPEENGNNVATAIVIDGSGNVYVTGYSLGLVTDYDYATVKYNSAGQEQWVARYNGPGNGNDRATAIVVDNSGNVYVTGADWGGSGAEADYATVKYNSAGQEQWVARYNGPANLADFANAIAVDGSGNVYVTGASIGTTYPDYDYVTIKYNSTGQQQWVARYNGPLNDDDEAAAIAVDASGNVYVTGYSEALHGNFVSPDYTTIKYNASGQEQWVALYNGPASRFDYATALAVDGSGNAYVTGYSENAADADYATIKYNSAGQEQWIARYDRPEISEEFANAIAVDNSGNVYVTGGSGHFDTGFAAATIKYNSAGQEQWVARYNGTANDSIATALALDPSGNVYVTGESLDPGTPYGDFDYATIKYNASGSEQWVVRYNGPGNGDDKAAAIAVDNSGNVYVTGQSFDSASIDYATIKYVQGQFCDTGTILNGGFETGDLTGWLGDGDISPVVITDNPHTGTFSAFAGNIIGPEPIGETSFYQEFTVPATGGTLSFWHWDFTNTTITFDWQDAYITDSNGNILQTIFHQCRNAQTWINEQVGLAAYVGQTVRIKFLVHQGGQGHDTAMYVDDVALFALCPSPTPSPTPSTTPTPTPTARPHPTPRHTPTPHPHPTPRPRR